MKKVDEVFPCDKVEHGSAPHVYQGTGGFLGLHAPFLLVEASWGSPWSTEA